MVGLEQRAVDWLLATALASLCVVEIWVGPVFQTGLPGPEVPMTCLALLACLPVGVRTTSPVPATAVASAAVVGLGLVGDRDQAGFELFLAVILIGYALGAHAEGRPLLVGLVCLVTVAPAYQLLTYGSDDSVVDPVVNVAFVLVPVGIGLEVRRQRSRAATSALRVTEVEADQERHTAEAVAEERATIAREMHDIIAHSISVMGVRAAGVRAVLPAELVQERAALLEIEQVGRDSLSEMHLLLGLLRDQGHDDQGLSPQPTLARLEELAKASGVEVDLWVTGERRPLPLGVELTAFRLVQEALTNARRHGGGGPVAVGLDYGPEHLRIDVLSSLRPGAQVGADGHGLIGMRERTALHGGTFRASVDDDRFVVTARIPVPR